MANVIYPNFYIVGAPKCGTSSLYTYLGQHPEIFVSEVKEPHYWAIDLNRYRAIIDEAAYIALFKEAVGYARVGEGSTMYLYSQAAAEQIARTTPRASIIIMIRQPIDMMYSLFYHNRFKMLEDQTDFAQALALEAEREQGRQIPGSNHHGALNLRYRYLAHYAPHIQRYQNVFGKDCVHIIVYNDLQKDVQRVYEATLTFLGVDSTFVADFKIQNANRTAKNPQIQQMLMGQGMGLRRGIRALLPSGVRGTVRALLLRLNSRENKKVPIDPELRRKLTVDLGDEITELEETIGRSLSAWRV